MDNWGRRCEYNYFKSNSEVIFSLGFDYGDDERYLRFPYWLISCFPPDASLETIRQIVDKTNARKDVVFRDKFCAFICRLDYFGDRAEFADIVGQIDDINFPSGFRHNDDALKLEFKDNKNEYLKQFRFNLCPENANDYGYVTEKIFDAFNAGCIPLYWGGGGLPETDIISKDAYVYVDKGDKDNLASALSFIRELNENEKLYKEFVFRPVYMPDAADIVYGYYIRLENKLKGLLK